MAASLLNVLAALLGLGLLVFLHELGHFFVARACGIRVEAFSIGFGKAIWSKVIDGVEWRLSVFPFGGYVRLAGMELSDETLRNPAPGSYFDSPIWARIAAIAAGPAANILVCLLCFTGVFFLGGRPKSWQELSPYVGSIPIESPFAGRKLRPGDRIELLDGRPYTGFRDLMMASLTQGPLTVTITPPQWDQLAATPFSLQVKRQTTRSPQLLWKPAQVLSLQEIHGENPLAEGSPLIDAGVRVGDRLIWLDGVLLWNSDQISSVLNDQRVLLTVQRKNRLMLTRVPRMRFSKLSESDPTWKDWYFSSAVGDMRRTHDFWVLPAQLSSNLEVQKSSKEAQQNSLTRGIRGTQVPFLAEEGLIEGDRIVAVDGFAVSNGIEIIQQLQKRQAHLIVQRSNEPIKVRSFSEAEKFFLEGFQPEALTALTHGFMEGQRLLGYGEFVMLNPVAVKPLSKFNMSPARADTLAIEANTRYRSILNIENLEERDAALEAFEKEQTQNILGVRAKGWGDQIIQYNPNPWTLFSDAWQQSWLTLKGIVTGKVGAQHVNSPVGVFVAMKSSWESSSAEGFYLLGFVSLSLAVFNLLPIPILDGGHIVLACVEGVTGKRPTARGMKWLFMPFFIALVALMLFTVWNDLAALFGLRG